VESICKSNHLIVGIRSKSDVGRFSWRILSIVRPGFV